MRSEKDRCTSYEHTDKSNTVQMTENFFSSVFQCRKEQLCTYFCSQLHVLLILCHLIILQPLDREVSEFTVI